MDPPAEKFYFSDFPKENNWIFSPYGDGFCFRKIHGRVNAPPLPFFRTLKKPATESVAGFSFCSYLTAYRAALAFSTRAAKAAASWIAISDRLLRFISMPAFFTPFMNLE